jgi:RimJ/RimL family protein N-acetyltransferase
MITLRVLTPDDAPAYREVRLTALRDHPEAYCTDEAEDAALSWDALRERLTPGATGMTFGALADHKLVGIASLVFFTRARLKFRALVAGMYVAPAHRRQGVATSLLAAAVDEARRHTEIEEVCLCVTRGNDTAREVYLAAGFTTTSIDPRYFKYNGRYYDLEWFTLNLADR